MGMCVRNLKLKFHNQTLVMLPTNGPGESNIPSSTLWGKGIMMSPDSWCPMANKSSARGGNDRTNFIHSLISQIFQYENTSSRLDYHVPISQVPPQLSWGNTCQIWMWCYGSNKCICERGHVPYGEITYWKFSDPLTRRQVLRRCLLFL